jgi:hypothetical protein
LHPFCHLVYQFGTVEPHSSPLCDTQHCPDALDSRRAI